MPKPNPKRKAKSQQVKAPSSSEPKKSGTYSRGSPKMTKFYGIIIIATIGTGLFFLFDTLYKNLPPAIAQWDHVQLQLRIWIFPTIGEWDESMDNVTSVKWYNFTTIYEPSTDTNVTVDKEGLPMGIYNKAREYNVGGKSQAFYIKNCIDLNKDKKDDYDNEPALGWGFPETAPFYNKTIVVKLEVLAIVRNS